MAAEARALEHRYSFAFHRTAFIGVNSKVSRRSFDLNANDLSVMNSA